MVYITISLLDRREVVDGWVLCSVFDNIILHQPTAAVVREVTTAVSTAVVIDGWVQCSGFDKYYSAAIHP